MMNNSFTALRDSILNCFSLTTGFILFFGGITLQPAQAALITYQFSGITDATPGPLPNESYTGQFTFDNAALTGLFTGEINVDTLQMTFLGTNFTQANAPVSAPPTVSFSNGTFLGLNFSVQNQTVNSGNLSFSFTPGTVDTTDAQFAYTFNIESGFGDVTYTPISTEPTPEPSPVFGLLGLGMLVFMATSLRCK